MDARNGWICNEMRIEGRKEEEGKVARGSERFSTANNATKINCIAVRYICVCVCVYIYVAMPFITGCNGYARFIMARIKNDLESVARI